MADPKKIPIEKWIEKNRIAIDQYITREYTYACEDDEERHEMILNDTGLYYWAKGEGTDI